MRIVIVASVDPAVHRGGAEQVAASLARALSEDHEVTVLSLANPGEPEGVSVPWQRARVPVNAPYHPTEADDASLLAQARWHAKELRSSEATRAVGQALDSHGPFEAASVHNVQGLGFGVFDALAEREIPTAYTAHDFKLASPVLNRRPKGPARLLAPLTPLYQAWVRRRTRSVDRFISPSRYVGEQLVGEGLLDAEQLRVVPNGVPIDVDHVLEGPARRLTTYGVLAEHKGILAFAEAFRASSSDLDLHIAGTGPLQPEIETLADQDPRITYLGFVPDEELATRVANSLAVVVPSLWPENCPMVVLESLSAGTPVVHTGRGGLSEICPPGELGLRLPEDPIDWNAFVETLDGPRLVDMRPRCRKTAEQRYSLSAMADSYEGILETIGAEA